MIIGIDGNEANVGIRVGISEYSFELLKQFRGIHVLKGELNPQFQIYLKNSPITDMPQESENWHYKILKPKRFWTQIGLPLYLYSKKLKPSVFFTPSHYAPRFSPVPTAISIMDVSYERFPELFNKSDLYQLQHWTKYSARNASAIFTISKSSKNDIIKYYNVEPEKVVVTYPGVKSWLYVKRSGFKDMEELRKKYNFDGKFILFVGTLQPRKNIVRLIEAFSKVIESKKEKVFLLVVGKKGWQYEEILAAPNLYNISDFVRFLSFVSDKELTLLYQFAECFVLPSLYEGFGLPILEAMNNDCPVITSNISSLPEAGGDAALYIDPNNSQDIAFAIKQVLENTKLRLQMIEKGKMQVKKFNWEKTAKQTIEVLKQIAKP